MDDEIMSMELTVEAYRERMQDEEWAEVVSEIFYMMSNGTREDAIAAAVHAAVRESEWYFEQAIHDAMALWAEAEKDNQFAADADANF